MRTTFNLPVAEITHRDTVFEDHFDNNIAGWEAISNEDEKAFIKEGHYFMENRSQNRWMFYHKGLPKDLPRNFVINTEIEVLDHGEYGQFGLVWGFAKPHHILNRFAVSTVSDRFTVATYEKDHHRVLHRFSGTYAELVSTTRKYFLSVMLLDDYYYFFLHHTQRPVYICHRSHLHREGSRFGFYVEPGIMIRADYIKVQRIITNPRFDGRAFMPLGSELLNGL